MLAICKLITILIKMKKVSFHKIDTEIKSNALYFNVINNLVAVINKPYCIKSLFNHIFNKTLLMLINNNAS